MPYFSDAALTKSGGDRFRRAPFASAIAATLSSLSDQSSLVIGIYGPWGDGKTTVLSFITEALSRNDKIITMSFNPWRFGTEDELLISFFHALVETLGQTLSSVKTKINEWKDLLGFLPHVGEAAKKLTDKLTYKGLEEFKRETEKILTQEGIRVVVLMDDIDRLETKEIQAIFRLVKLTASFNNVAYVLAFDEKVVSAALQEKYGTINQSGQGFLEKIIQVPLHLPKIPATVLLEFCHECVAQALQTTDLRLDQEQEKEFRAAFESIATQIHTPRQCKRYANGLAFALRMLKGEVNLVDLLSIEAVRIFQPALYEIIRSNKGYFLGEVEISGIDEEAFTAELLSPVWQGVTSEAREAIKRLLRRLFPSHGRLKYEQQKAAQYDPLADRQRIASTHYFNRFFTYSVPLDEFSDREIAKLLSKISPTRVAEVAKDIRRLISSAVPGGADAFISQLGLRRELLTPDISGDLARALSLVSDQFDCFYGSTDSWYFSDAVLLVRQLILNDRSAGQPGELMRDILKNASVPFGLCCLRSAAEPRESQKPYFSVYGSLDWDSNTAAITVEEYQRLIKATASAFKKYFDSSKAYEPASRRESALVMDAWREGTSDQEVHGQMESIIRANPRYAVGIIHWYVSDASSAPIAGEKRYRDITRVLRASNLIEALEAEFKSALRSSDIPDARLDLARAFLSLHAKWEQSQRTNGKD